MKRRTYAFGLSNLHLEFGNITTSNAQVIVSSDDYYLSMGGGVSAAIRRAGGEAISLDASKKAPARLGDVVVTAAGSLAAQHIFHAITIGPNTDESPAGRVIETTTRRCLELLDVMRLHSIAFPAIGAGVAGFDYDDVAMKMAEVIAPFLAERNEPLDVTIYLYDRYGTKTPIDYVTFFEEFRVRVPTIAAHEVDSEFTSITGDFPLDAPPVGNPDDPRVRRHQILKELASLEEERNTLEQLAVKMGVLGDEQAMTRTRQALREIEDRRLENLALLRSDKKTSLEIFFSYAHEDESLRDELAKHLNILQRQEIIAEWHDRKITAGTEWEGQINLNLDSADIILLLISPDFIASNYCYDVELKRALERHESGEARVIPVILRPVRWSGTSFSKLQALPTDGKPVTKWDDQDSAFLNITEGIMTAIEEMDSNRKQSA